MKPAKLLTFNAPVVDYMFATFFSVVLIYVPFIGWAFLVNYLSSWYADHATINGKQITFRAEYMETLKFVSLHALFVLLTFGIYIFWFIPKLYSYIADHVEYVEAEVETITAESPAASPRKAVRRTAKQR